jgi:glycosyltransferase involved in cell wall biosynthesis
MNITVSVIIPIWDSEEMLQDVILNAKQLDPLEIIVVAKPGSIQDVNSFEKKMGCKIVLNENNFRENSARIIGASEARGKVLLFLDGNYSLPSSVLAKFITPILTGHVDVVLNSLEKLLLPDQPKEMIQCSHCSMKFTQFGKAVRFGCVHCFDAFKELLKPLSAYVVWSQILNELMDKRDLNIDTLCAFPHALSNQVIQSIDVEYLSNPIQFQVKIIEHEWEIRSVDITDWIPSNRACPLQEDDFSEFLEVLLELIQKKGIRGGFSNGGKRLDILEKIKETGEIPSFQMGWGENSSKYGGKQLSIIIPAQNEEATIGKVINEARKLEPKEIIAVVNGSYDKTASTAKGLGATVIEYPERLGHNVGRAIGAFKATGDILLFIDSDFAIPSTELQPFVESITNGVDMALNDLNVYLPICYPLHNVSALKYALNLLCNKKTLGIGALLAVPHAISRTCLEKVGFESLVCPSLAQVKAMLHGLNVQCVYAVDVMQPNRMRPEQHLGSYIEGGSRFEMMEYIRKQGYLPYCQELYKTLPPVKSGWGMTSSLYNGDQLSVIIAAQNHGKTIEKVIREARKIEPLEVIVVVSGSSDDSEMIARKLGTTVIVFKEELDPGIARSIGALASAGSIIYFVDAALKGQTQAEMRIMGDHLEAISYFLLNNSSSQKQS